MTANSSIPEMLRQSRAILTSPSVANFERFEGRGNLADALIYVTVAAAITGVFGLAEGIGGFLRNILGALLGFLIFTYLVHWIGTRRGGTGTVDEVAYSFALFWAPLSVLFGVAAFLLAITIIGIVLIPLVLLAAFVINIFFAYLAVQSSLNLEGGGPTWTVLILAAVASLVLNLIVGALLG